MEQEFQLKYHCHFNLFEMAIMSAEDRAFHLKRMKEQIDKENENVAKEGRKGYGGRSFV